MSAQLKTGRLSAKKVSALAAAHRGRREAARERQQLLRVPKVFEGAREFLAEVARIVQQRAGANREIADGCKVSTSTVSKWFKGKLVPTQPNIDQVVEWWGKNQKRGGEQAEDAGPGAPRQLSLMRLPKEISARLRKAAKHRNVDPITLAAQILDRKLPRIEEMD